MNKKKRSNDGSEILSILADVCRIIGAVIVTTIEVFRS